MYYSHLTIKIGCLYGSVFFVLSCGKLKSNSDKKKFSIDSAYTHDEPKNNIDQDQSASKAESNKNSGNVTNPPTTSGSGDKNSGNVTNPPTTSGSGDKNLTSKWKVSSLAPNSNYINQVKIVGKTNSIMLVGGPLWQDGEGFVGMSSNFGKSFSWSVPHLNNSKDGGYQGIASGWLWGIVCKNERECWTSGRWNGIFYTSDAGQNWQHAWINTDNYDHRYTYGINIAGDKVIVGGTAAEIFYSTSNVDFNKVKDPTINVVLPKIECPSALVCYSVGIDAFIRIPVDGSNKYEREWPNIINPNFLDAPMNELVSLSFISESEGWIINSNGAAGKTIDKGKSFSLKLKTDKKILFDIKAISSKFVIVGGEKGLILRSTDGGDSWQQDSLPPEVVSDIITIDFLDEMHGVAGTRDGKILVYSPDY